MGLLTDVVVALVSLLVRSGSLQGPPSLAPAWAVALPAALAVLVPLLTVVGTTLGTLLAGAVLAAVDRRFVDGAVSHARRRPGQSIGAGVLVTSAVAVLALASSAVAPSVGPASLAVLALVAAVGGAVGAAVVGGEVLRSDRTASFGRRLAVGACLTAAATLVPGVGLLLLFGVQSLGVGAVVARL